MNNTLHNILKYHVTGAIERGEAHPIVEIPAQALQALCLGSIEHIVLSAWLPDAIATIAKAEGKV